MNAPPDEKGRPGGGGPAITSDGNRRGPYSRRLSHSATPAVTLSYSGDRFRVAALFASPNPGERLGGTFDKHVTAWDYARRLAARKGWRFLNAPEPVRGGWSFAA